MRTLPLPMSLSSVGSSFIFATTALPSAWLPKRLDGTQIVEHGRVNSNDGIARHAALRREILLGECPVGIILIPIPGIGENEACAVLSPSAWISVMKIKRPASF